MFRTAWRNVLAHRARLLMTVLAVMLGVAFVSGTLVFTDSVSDAYTRSAEKSFTGVDVQLRPAKSAVGHDTGRLLDQRLLDEAGALPGTASATGVVSGFAALAGKDGRLVGEGWSTTGANYDGPDARYPLAVAVLFRLLLREPLLCRLASSWRAVDVLAYPIRTGRSGRGAGTTASAGPCFHIRPGPRSAGTGTSSSSRSAGTMTKRGVW